MVPLIGQSSNTLCGSGAFYGLLNPSTIDSFVLGGPSWTCVLDASGAPFMKSTSVFRYCQLSLRIKDVYRSCFSNWQFLRMNCIFHIVFVKFNKITFPKLIHFAHVLNSKMYIPLPIMFSKYLIIKKLCLDWYTIFH
jgi:hypothetical protein